MYIVKLGNLYFVQSYDATIDGFIFSRNQKDAKRFTIGDKATGLPMELDGSGARYVKLTQKQSAGLTGTAPAHELD